jgi:hypothetical protein
VWLGSAPSGLLWLRRGCGGRGCGGEQLRHQTVRAAGPPLVGDELRVVGEGHVLIRVTELLLDVGQRLPGGQEPRGIEVAQAIHAEVPRARGHERLAPAPTPAPPLDVEGVAGRVPQHVGVCGRLRRIPEPGAEHAVERREHLGRGIHDAGRAGLGQDDLLRPGIEGPLHLNSAPGAVEVPDLEAAHLARPHPGADHYVSALGLLGLLAGKHERSPR